MGRAKLKMELIPKEKTRNTTYHKRKHGIMKKANEFTILCDVDTVIIIYPPNSDKPEIWPENPEKIKKIIDCYKAKKGHDTGKRTYDLNDFYEDRKKKIEDELVKARKKNMEAKYATWFDDLDAFNEPQLRQFAMGLESKENVVRAQLEFKKRNINIQLPFMFDHHHHHDHDHDQGLIDHVDHVGHGQVMNHHFVSHDRGWFGDGAPVGSFVPMKREPVGFGCPVFDGGVGFDGVNQWVFQQPVVHGGVVPEFVRDGDELQVNNTNNNNNNNNNNNIGVGEFVMDDHRVRFMNGY